MGCYAKVNTDERNATAAEDDATGDNDHDGGGVGVHPTRRRTTLTTTRAAAVVAMTMTGGSRNTATVGSPVWGTETQPIRK